MRIVSLAPSNTEILFAIGAGGQIVATTSYCDYPQKAKKLPKVGGWTTVSYDLIRKYKPDLVLTSTVVQQEAPKMFSDEQFRTIHFDVKTVDGIYESIHEIGDLVGKTTNAKSLTQKIRSRLNKVHLRGGVWLSTREHLGGGPRHRIYIEEWMDPAMASGNWVTELVEIAGGLSILKKGEISRKVTKSEVEKFDPDVIVLAYCGYMDKSDPSIIKKRWPKLRAVRKDKIFVIDERVLNRPGPRIWQAAQELQKIIADL